VKSAHLTNGSGYSSWLTAQVQDSKHSGTNQLANGMRDLLVNQVNWPTPQTSDQNGAASSDRPAHRKQLRDVEHGLGLPAPANPSTHGNRQESWGTPAANDANKTPHCEVNSKQAGLAKSVGLEMRKQWATPRANKVHPEITEDNRDQLANRNKSNLEEEIAGHCGKATGKLNPRWVETLMGLPIGWTMPSCTRPVTIEPMNCDCLGTESSQPPQNEHLELF
jgi:hypothetical protein